MRIVKSYICDFCSKVYSTKDKAIECEQSHSIDEKLQLIKDAVLCPTCKGKGYYYGNDGCDVRTCYVCNGKGIVISATEIQRVYKRIGE